MRVSWAYTLQVISNNYPTLGVYMFSADWTPSKKYELSEKTRRRLRNHYCKSYAVTFESKSILEKLIGDTW